MQDSKTLSHFYHLLSARSPSQPVKGLLIIQKPKNDPTRFAIPVSLFDPSPGLCLRYHIFPPIPKISFVQ